MPASTPASSHVAELDAPSSGFVVRGDRGFALLLLLVEKITLIADPTYVPTYSINPILSCGSVMRTEQSEVFGFPNPILGVAGFAIVATTGAALLAGASLRWWYWLGLQGGTIFGVAFIH